MPGIAFPKHTVVKLTPSRYGWQASSVTRRPAPKSIVWAPTTNSSILTFWVLSVEHTPFQTIRESTPFLVVSACDLHKKSLQLPSFVTLRNQEERFDLSPESADGQRLSSLAWGSRAEVRAASVGRIRAGKE